MAFFIPALYLAGAAALSFLAGCGNQSEENQESPPGGLPQPKEKALKPKDPSKKLEEVVGKTKQPQSILTREQTREIAKISAAGGQTQPNQGNSDWKQETEKSVGQRQWMLDAVMTNSVLQYCQVGPDFDSCVQRQESHMDSFADLGQRQWMLDAIMTNSVLQYCQVGPDFDSCVQRQESHMDSYREWLSE